jgi:hypothetical protein
VARPQLPASSRPTYFGGTPTSAQGYDRPDLADDPVYQAQNRPGALDFSDQAIQQRQGILRQQAIDELQASRQLLAEAGPTGWVAPGAVPEGFQDGTPLARANQAYVAYTIALHGTRASNLQNYPTLAKAAIEANVDEADLARLVNYAEVDRAAERVLGALNLLYNEEGDQAKSGLGQYQVDNILNSANPVMKAAILDVVAEKIKEIEAPGGTDSASWADTVLENAGKILETVFAPFDAANRAVQQTVRASQYGSMQEGYDPIGIESIQNIFQYWDKVSEGNYDQKLLSSARQEFGPAAVDLVLAVEKKTLEGDPDPLVSVMMEQSNNPETMNILSDMLFGENSTGVNMAEVSRAVDNAALGNTGQLFLTSILGDTGMGSEGRAVAANAGNIVATLALDPTLLAGKIRAAYITTRFALEKIAPGASRAGIKSALNMRPTRVYFEGLFNQLNRYDELVKSDPGKAAVLREQIRRQYPEIPDNTIDVFANDGVRTVDDLIEWTVETNEMFTKMAKGQPATGLITAGESAAPEPLANAIFNRGQAQTREALLPRTSIARRSRSSFARMVSPLMPSRRGQAVIEDVYGNTSDPAEFVETISDVGNAARAGRIERGRNPDDVASLERQLEEAKQRLRDANSSPDISAAADEVIRLEKELGAVRTDPSAPVSAKPGAVGKRVDTVFKYFSSIGIGHVNIVDGRDAKQIYRYARMFLSRRHAAYWADMWRKATPSQRYNMMIGLNRTAAAAKGLDLADPEMLSRVDELVTATRTKTSFSAKSPTLSQAAAPVEAPAAWPGGPALFHGTSRPIGRFRPTDEETEFVAQGFGTRTFAQFEEGPLSGDQSTSLYGGIFYATVDRERAATYMKKGAAKPGRARKADVWDEQGRSVGTIYGLPDEPRMYNVRWVGSEPPRLLDLDQPAPQRLRDLASGAGFFDEIGINAADDYADEFAALLSDPQSTGAQILDFIRTRGGSEAFGNLQAVWMTLADEGFDGYRHVGGTKAGRGQKLHDVYIFFNENNINAIPEPEAVASTIDMTIPSLYPDGSEKAQFGWQTASHVALPSLREMEKLGRWQRFVREHGGTIGDAILATPQNATDIWSLGTLFGLRFSLRSAIEDWWFYAVITGGNLKDLYKGRRMSTMLRETRGRMRETALSGGKKEVPALGMINRRARAVGDMLENRDTVVAQILSKFIRGNLDQQEVQEATQAARRGNFDPMRRLAGVAMASARMTGLKPAEREYLLDLVDGPFGLKLLDELAETGKTLNSGGLVDEAALPVAGTDTVGVSAGALPRVDNGKLVPVGDYTPELPVEDALPESFLYWERNINGVMLGDGPAGRIAVAYLDDPQEAIRRVADEIREDPTGYGYKWRFAALESESPEMFAARKIQAVRALFSDAQGNLNENLWRKVVSPDRTVTAYKEAEDGTRSLIIDFGVLKALPKEQRPSYVSGQVYGTVPNADGLGAFMDRSWSWMGEQYARISREPIFLANYLAHRRQLAGYQKQLAEDLGEKASRRVVARMAEDRAYSFTLSYMDNPQNRSLLAYKVRNVSRYYRATEDFYRRAMRAGKNYPVGLWKTALIYDVLDDTGFVYTDDNGEKYFLYPGTNQLMSAMNAVMGKVAGQDPMAMPYPFVQGGKVRMLAPSTDPNQLAPTMAGPWGTIAWKLLARRFPTLSRLNRVVLGEYGTTGEGSVIDDFTTSFFPGQLQRVVNTLSDDEVDSMMAASAKDALTIAVVNDLIPEDENSPEFANAMAKIDLIAWSAVLGRFFTGFIVPASPQQFNANISEFARMNRIVAPRPTYLKLIQKYTDQGAENPVGAALADWWKLDQKLMPFTVSRTQDVGEGVRGTAPMKTATSVLDWYNNNRTGIIEKYPQTAYFLAPQDEGFDWNTWGLIVAEGLRVPKPMLDKNGDPGPFLRDLFAAKGEFQYYATIADYQRDIDALDPRDPDQYSRIKDLEADRSVDLEGIRTSNPYLDLKLAENNNWGERDVVAERALTQTKRMVDELFDSTPKADWNGSPAQAIRNAIYTYIDYASEIKMTVGADDASEYKRRMLRLDLEADLNGIAEASPNAKLFIRNVLMSDPDIKVLDLELVGAANE